MKQAGCETMAGTARVCFISRSRSRENADQDVIQILLKLPFLSVGFPPTNRLGPAFKASRSKFKM